MRFPAQNSPSGDEAHLADTDSAERGLPQGGIVRDIRRDEVDGEKHADHPGADAPDSQPADRASDRRGLGDAGVRLDRLILDPWFRHGGKTLAGISHFESARMQSDRLPMLTK